MIVDASVAFKWIFIEDGSDLATALVGREDLIAPTLLLAEVGNALWKKGRRGEIGDAPAFRAQLALVASLVTTVDEAQIVPAALDLARRLDHPVYDCIYLALAREREDVLVSADRKFVEKVARTELAALIRSL